MSSVSLDAVTVDFAGGARGLDTVDLTVEDGEFLALVGPSGSGKTTLLRVVAGFLRPTAGSVSIGSRQVAGARVFVPPEERRLGMVFQQHAVWPHWNVGRNIDYPLRRAGVTRVERVRRVEEVLALVGLEGAARRDPASLSGGQRQRVALARALVARPRVLLLDEALSALDEPLRDRLRLELRSLTRELGLTVAHVTHDRSEALALADRVAVLQAGRIVQVDAPQTLVEHPRSAFVAGFLSDATCVTGVVEAGRFVGNDHPLRLGGVPPGLAGTVEAAILPDAVDVRNDPTGPGVVRSSLFTREGADLVVDWAGIAVRARTHGVRPAVGDRVAVDVRSALFYPIGVEENARD